MIRDAGMALIIRVAGTVLWLCYTVLLARLLSTPDFGLVFYAINFILLTTSISSMGYETSMLRFGSHYWHQEKKQEFAALLNQARLVAVLGGSACAIAFLISVGIDVDFPLSQDPLVAVLIAGCLVLTALMYIHRGTLRGADKLISALLGFTVVRVLLVLAATLVLALLGVLTVTSAMAALLFALVGAVAFEMWQIRMLGVGGVSAVRLDRSKRQRVRREALVAAFGIWPGNIASEFIKLFAGLIVGVVLGLEAAALYLAAERVASLGLFLTDAVHIAAAPQVARAAAHPSGQETLQDAVSRSSALMFLAGLAGFAVLGVSGWFVLAILGPVFVDAYSVLLVLLIGQLSYAAFGPAALVLNMAGQERVASMMVVGMAALLIASTIFATLFFGILGAACAYAAVWWLLNGMMVFVAKRRLGVLSGLFGISMTDLLASVHSLKDAAAAVKSRGAGRRL